MAERVGFTGSRQMTPGMRAYIEETIEALPGDTIVVTGGCIGVDAYAASVAYRSGLEVYTILPANRELVHPLWRSVCTSYYEMPKGTTYRDRNREIVKASDRLYVVPIYPEDHPSSRRSGTWMTARIARQRGCPIYIYIA